MITSITRALKLAAITCSLVAFMGLSASAQAGPPGPRPRPPTPPRPRPKPAPKGKIGPAATGGALGKFGQSLMHVQKRFKGLDANGNGLLDRKEAKKGPGPDALDPFKSDRDRDGALSFAEFRKHAAHVVVSKVFALLDLSRNGVLSRGEYPIVLTDYDKDGDEEISQSEMLNYALGAIDVGMAFRRADENQDDALSRSEWPSGSTADFRTVDGDKDNAVSALEAFQYYDGKGKSPF